MIHCHLDQHFMFENIHSRRFTRGPDHDDTIGSLFNMEINQRAKSREIKAAVFLHRSHNCDDTTFNHDGAELSK